MIARYEPINVRGEAIMSRSVHGDFVEHEDHLSAIAAKDAEINRLRLALEEARGMVAHWGAYASEYFQDKHDLPGDLGELDAVLAEASDAS